VAIFSPHDDDGVLGAGHLIQAIFQNEGNVFVFIFCTGNGGYTAMQYKDKIVDIRRKETVLAYEQLGVPSSNIIRFEYSDYSVGAHMGWQLPDGFEGTYPTIIRYLRGLGVTRLVIPNRYREHYDHESVGRIGAFDGPQAGDTVLAEWGRPTRIKSFLEYTVWGDFSPEDALMTGSNISIRANRAIKGPMWAENNVISAIRKFESQKQIIQHLIDSRAERHLNDGAIELYVQFDARPLLPFEPYIKFIAGMDERGKG
jgi:hypothetical protein